MFAQSGNTPINPTKAPGSPGEREPFDPYPDKSPVIDEPPEEEEEVEKDYDPAKGTSSSKTGQSAGFLFAASKPPFQNSFEALSPLQWR
ncbi:hypothetical protein [Gluconobacter oxydans]|uniref:hypothetical protein n=1 Tax=Gluconobacter oxydans TaxID=442 RepID=UPI0039EB17CE